jgi:molybdopterin synthase catalytic subunit
MAIYLLETPFEPWARLSEYESTRPELAGRFGATAVFVGTMRDFNEGTAVRSMVLEHYAPMTRRHLEKICEEARTRWDLLDTLVIHRYGPLQPNDPIVLVAAWSAHREAALAACRYLIDELKTRAPFWKQEDTAAGTRWVETNT